ncbi:MAG: hypothetical protein AMXMBFR47_18130 [Planctomycetota bacterium]
MPDWDPFLIYQWMLMVLVTVYYAVVMAVAGWQIATVLRGSDPKLRMLRLYLSYQLVTIRLRPLASELLQIGVWGAGLAGLWWAHTRIS